MIMNIAESYKIKLIQQAKGRRSTKIGFTSPVQFEIMEELGFSTAEYSLFGSVIDIGAGLAALVGCKLTDYIGRRCALGLADISYIIGWLAIAVGQGARLLDLGRLMLGFGLGIAIYAGPIYVSEFTPKNLRGVFVVLSLLIIATGTALVFIIGLIIPWRILALLGLIPSLVQIVGLFFTPESPRWLLMMGKDEEFEAALQWFRGASADISQEAADIKEGAEALEELSKVTILQIFQKKYAYVLTVGVGLSALSCICGLKGILYYASSIFESAGFSAAVGTVALALFQLPSMVLGMFVLDKFGRRPLLMFSAAGVCLGCLLAGFSFFFQDHHLLKGFSPYLSLIGLLIYYCAYPIGLGGASAVLTRDIPFEHQMVSWLHQQFDRGNIGMDGDIYIQFPDGLELFRNVFHNGVQLCGYASICGQVGARDKGKNTGRSTYVNEPRLAISKLINKPTL